MTRYVIQYTEDGRLTKIDHQLNLADGATHKALKKNYDIQSRYHDFTAARGLFLRKRKEWRNKHQTSPPSVHTKG